MKKYIISGLIGAILTVLAVLLFNTSGEKPVIIEDGFFSEIAEQNAALESENRALVEKAKTLQAQLESASKATTAAEKRAANIRQKVKDQASPADHRDDLIASLETVIDEQREQLKNSLELNHVYTLKIANLQRMFDNTKVALDLRTQQFDEALEKNKRLTKKVKFYRVVATLTLGGVLVAIVFSLFGK